MSSAEILPDTLGLQRYDEWNTAIAEEFFSGTSSGSPVYLDLEHEVAERICETIGCDLEDVTDQLGQAVRGTLDFTGTGNPFRVHLSRLRAWRESGSVEAPPIVSLLAFFSLVAEVMVADREFAANNYYGRLARMLGVDADQSKRLVDGYRRGAQICWDELNEWLIDWDGELGLPTARSLDRRRYVSIAISQALVREHDRAQLARMFEDCGLLPRHAMSELEMRQLIQHWVSGVGTGSSIARLWSRGDDVRDRVTEIACAELGEWDGALGQDQAPRAAGEERTLSLTLAAELHQHPLPALDLYLLCPGDPTREAGRYALEDGSSTAASLAIEGCEDQLRLEDMQGDGLLSLEPWSQISVGDLLVGSFALRSTDDPARHLRRGGKTLIVLAYHEHEDEYREISQVPLMTRSLVLCRQELAERVQAHLLACARDGFRVLGPDDLPGVPSAWVAFVDVQVLVPRESRGLEVLVPAMDRQMALVGGLLVGRDTWHEDACPEFQFAFAQGDKFTVEIDRVRALDAGGKVSHILGPFEGACALILSELDLPVGDYQIKVRRASGRTDIALARFRLRSADIPRPHTVVRVPMAAFDTSPAATLNPIAPEVYVEHLEGTGALQANRIQGATITDDIVRDRASNGPTIALPREPAPIAPEDATRQQRRARLASRATLEEDCEIRGYHFWHCDSYGPGDSRDRLMRQRCTECGLEIWTTQVQRMGRNRGGKRGRRSATTPTNAARRRTPKLPRIEAGIAGNLDLILDAISYQGGGSWNQFQQMARFIDDAPLFAYEAARILSSLGHLELLFDPHTMRPRSYRVAPPALVEVSGGRLAVAGARSSRLLDALAVVNSDLELELSCERSSAGLTAIFITAGSHEDDRAAGQLISEQFGELVAVSLDFATRAIGTARPISELLPHLPRIRMGSQPAERFDVVLGRWVEVTRPEEPGAYRLRWHGTTYAYIDGTDGDLETGVIVDPRTIKHLAARREGASLIGYNAAAQQLIAAPGCEMPALLERVAVLCSGLPSQRRDDGRIVYLNVPDHVAHGCWRCLSS